MLGAPEFHPSTPTASPCWSGGNRCTAGSVLHFVPDRADYEGQKRSELGGLRIWAGSVSDSETDPAQIPIRNDSRPVHGTAVDRVATAPITAPRALRPPWHSSDPGPSGRSQQQPTGPTPPPRTAGDPRKLRRTGAATGTAGRSSRRRPWVRSARCARRRGRIRRGSTSRGRSRPCRSRAGGQVSTGCRVR